MAEPELATFGPRDTTEAALAEYLDRLPGLAIAVVGDFFLDKYLVIDRALSETSLETGLESYQVVAKRCSPGAAGTVTSNLRALGVGTVYAVGLTGDDGEGYELRHGLASTGVSTEYLVQRADCYTPTYTKPMVREGATERELERLDMKNRRSLPAEAEDAILARLEACIERVDGVMVSDQVQERNHGVITDRVRVRLAELSAIFPDKVFSVDSRTRVGEFRGLLLKPNRSEAALALDPAHGGEITRARAAEIGLALSERAGRPVYLTLSEDGVLVCAAVGVPWGRATAATPAARDACVHVAGIPVPGPIDPVGAGDSTCAGIVSALCAGATPAEAALVGNLVASITIEQLGTTGTATPAQVLARYREQAGLA